MALIAPVLGALALAGCGGESTEGDSGGTADPEVSGPLPREGGLLFVLRGPATVIDDTIEIDADTVEWFTDRPERQAGVARAADLVQDWEDYGFAHTPPNAAIAGDDTDAEVVLKQPEATAEGVSFAFETLRGNVAEGDDSNVSVFVDSSEWETDMHVYVRSDSNANAETSGWCDQSEETVLGAPQINSSPDNWSYYPTDSITLTGDDQEIFTAASKNGTTNFAVTYNVNCEGGGDATFVGQVKFTGTVPDNPIEDSFNCRSESIESANPSEKFLCFPSDVSGYHVDAKARILYGNPGGNPNPQITD